MERKTLIAGTVILLAVVLAVLHELLPWSEESAPASLVRTQNKPASGPADETGIGVPAKSRERERTSTASSKGWALAMGIERHFPASSILITEAAHRVVEEDAAGRKVEEWEIRSYCHDNCLDRLTALNTREGITEFFVTLHQETGDELFAVNAPDALVSNLLASENKQFNPDAPEGAGNDSRRFPFVFQLTVKKRSP